MPDGNGGKLPSEDAEQIYALAREAAETESYWAGTFTKRRVVEVTSRHNGCNYVQRVGTLTSDRLFILAIFESQDEYGKKRFIARSLYKVVHIDASKVVEVKYFAA